VPTLAQLSWSAAEALAFVLLTAGMAALVLAVIVGEVSAIRAAGAIAAGALAFAATLARIIGHLRSPSSPHRWRRPHRRRPQLGHHDRDAMTPVRPTIAGGSDAATAVTPAQVMQALRKVFDPELGMSIVELGLVYGIDVRGGAVTVTMTLTAPGCPIHDVMPEWVMEAVTKIPGVEHIDVTITFDPPWTPDRIARP
jgi:metal-sulfur cluster biosynthetic enzyme